MTTRTHVAVALCGDLESETGLEPAAVARGLRESLPDIRVDIVPGLCRSPEHMPSLASRAGAGRIALGLCARPTGNDEFQAWSRKAGLDPFAVELVNLNGGESAETAVLVLAGAVARLRAFPGSRPEELKLRLFSFEQRRSRRSLFTLPPTTYAAVASIEEASCLGQQRCGRCISTCPFSAIGSAGGKVTVDRKQCESCGLCVTACPTNAIGLPGSALAQYEAEIAALLAADQPNLLLTCRQAACTQAEGNRVAALSAGWLPVEVPCLGMVTPGWILQALARGASTIALLGCGERCRSDRATVGRERLDFVRELLHLLGESAPSQKVLWMDPGSALTQADAGPASTRDRSDDRAISLLEPAATTAAAMALAERYGAPPVISLTHAGSPLGMVKLREETCTACGACAAVCPTEALLCEEGARGETVISFEAGRCVACGNCVSACPEAALDTLSVHAGIVPATLVHGRTALKRAASTHCRQCGRAIAPDAMLNRIRTLLEGDEASGPLIAILTQLCSDCRALGSDPSVGGKEPGPVLASAEPGLGS